MADVHAPRVVAPFGEIMPRRAALALLIGFGGFLARPAIAQQWIIVAPFEAPASQAARAEPEHPLPHAHPLRFPLKRDYPEDYDYFSQIDAYIALLQRQADLQRPKITDGTLVAWSVETKLRDCKAARTHLFNHRNAVLEVLKVMRQMHGFAERLNELSIAAQHAELAAGAPRSRVLLATTLAVASARLSSRTADGFWTPNGPDEKVENLIAGDVHTLRTGAYALLEGDPAKGIPPPRNRAQRTAASKMISDVELLRDDWLSLGRSLPLRESVSLSYVYLQRDLAEVAKQLTPN
jgi:hypothetical protein